jgi:hypothetical protein
MLYQRAGSAKIPAHGNFGDVQQLRYFLHIEASQHMQFEYIGLARVELPQAIQQLQEGLVDQPCGVQGLASMRIRWLMRP